MKMHPNRLRPPVLAALFCPWSGSGAQAGDRLRRTAGRQSDNSAETTRLHGSRPGAGFDRRSAATSHRGVGSDICLGDNGIGASDRAMKLPFLRQRWRCARVLCSTSGAAQNITTTDSGIPSGLRAAHCHIGSSSIWLLTLLPRADVSYWFGIHASNDGSDSTLDVYLLVTTNHAASETVHESLGGTFRQLEQLLKVWLLFRRANASDSLLPGSSEQEERYPSRCRWLWSVSLYAGMGLVTPALNRPALPVDGPCMARRALCICSGR